MEGSFDLFLDCLTHPVFPENDLERKKGKIIGKIESLKDDPTETAKRKFREVLFKEGPYDHPLEGTKETLEGFTRERVSRFYANHYQPNTSVLVVVGDITLNEVRDKLVPRLSQWPQGEAPGHPRRTLFSQGPRTFRGDRDLSQANIVMGHRGIERGNPDYYAVKVMNHILGGGGFSSRLMETIRVKEGLAYSVRSRFQARKYSGTFEIVLQTKNASAWEAVDLVLRDMERMRTEPVSREELETAKKYLIGSFPLRLDTQSGLAAFIAGILYYDLGLGYPEKYPSLIQSVGSEDVLQAAKDYLHPDECVISVIGDLEEIGKNPRD